MVSALAILSMSVSLMVVMVTTVLSSHHFSITASMAEAPLIKGCDDHTCWCLHSTLPNKHSFGTTGPYNWIEALIRILSATMLHALQQVAWHPVVHREKLLPYLLGYKVPCMEAVALVFLHFPPLFCTNTRTGCTSCARLTWCGGDPPIFHSSCCQLNPGYLELPPCNSSAKFYIFWPFISPDPYPPICAQHKIFEGLCPSAYAHG